MTKESFTALATFLVSPRVRKPDGERSLDYQAGSTIRFDTVATSGDALLNAQGDIVGNSVVSSGGSSRLSSATGSVDLNHVSGASSIAVSAATDIMVDAAQSGGLFSAVAGNTITSGSVTSGSLDYQAGSTIRFDTVATSGDALLNAQGDVVGNSVVSSGGSSRLSSATGSVDLNRVSSASGIVVSAATDIVVDAAQSGGLFSAVAGNTITSGSVTSGSLDYQAGGTIRFDTVATSGDALLSAQGDVVGNSVVSSGGSSSLSSAIGSVGVGAISVAENLYVNAPNSINAAGVTIGGSLFFRAGQIAANVTGNGDNVYGGSIGGFDGGPASSVNLLLASPSAFNFTSLSMVNGTITVSQGGFGSEQTYVGQRLILSNPSIDLLVDQTRRSVQPYDVQLYSGGSEFRLGLVANHVYTDALAIHRDSQADVISPGANGSSATEQANDVVTKSNKLGAQAGAPRSIGGDSGANVTYCVPAVALDERRESSPERVADCDNK